MAPAILLWLGGALVAALPGGPPEPAPVVAAQDGPVAVRVNPADHSPVLVLQDPLGSERVRSALDSGLPVRIRITVELWRDRFVDSQEDRAEWGATVVRDPLADEYRVELEGASLERHRLGSLAAARALLSRRVPLDLRPRNPGRYYYLAHVEIETLSLSDLDELRRWLRGDLGPAAEGEVEGALTRGFRRLLIRLLGAPVQRYEVRSPRFEHGG